MIFSASSNRSLMTSTSNTGCCDWLLITFIKWCNPFVRIDLEDMTLPSNKKISGWVEEVTRWKTLIQLDLTQQLPLKSPDLDQLISTKWKILINQHPGQIFFYLTVQKTFLGRHEEMLITASLCKSSSRNPSSGEFVFLSVAKQQKL